MRSSPLAGCSATLPPYGDRAAFRGFVGVGTKGIPIRFRLANNINNQLFPTHYLKEAIEVVVAVGGRRSIHDALGQAIAHVPGVGRGGAAGCFICEQVAVVDVGRGCSTPDRGDGIRVGVAGARVGVQGPYYVVGRPVQIPESYPSKATGSSALSLSGTYLLSSHMDTGAHLLDRQLPTAVPSLDSKDRRDLEEFPGTPHEREEIETSRTPTTVALDRT